MKKMFIWMSAIVLGIVLLTGCEKDESTSKKATVSNVLKYLPGTWKISGYLDEGVVEDVYDRIVMTFGKEDKSNPYSGSYSLTVNGYEQVSNGKWYIEPSDDKYGVYLYVTDDEYNMLPIPGGDGSIVYITTISSSYMEVLFDEDSDEGYAFERID